MVQGVAGFGTNFEGLKGKAWYKASLEQSISIIILVRPGKVDDRPVYLVDQ